MHDYIFPILLKRLNGGSSRGRFTGEKCCKPIRVCGSARAEVKPFNIVHHPPEVVHTLLDPVRGNAKDLHDGEIEAGKSHIATVEHDFTLMLW